MCSIKTTQRTSAGVCVQEHGSVGHSQVSMSVALAKSYVL